MRPREINRERNAWIIMVGSLLLLGIVRTFHNELYAHYEESNSIALHTLLEFFSVLVSFSISIYGWNAYRETPSALMLWLPILFFSVGAFDLIHALTFKGMPYFLGEGSTRKTAWFWIFGRLTEAIGMIWLLLIRPGQIQAGRASWMLLFPTLFIFSASVGIFQYEQSLPVLIIEDRGPTVLKNVMEYIGSALHAIALGITYRRYRRSRDPAELDLMLAFFFLLFSGVLLTVYTSTLDMDVQVGHVFKVLGYVFILKAYYFSRLRITFELRKQTEQDLHTARNLLESFVYHTPDSIAILSKDGVVLRVNPGFEQVYGWAPCDVTGRRLQDLMPMVKEDIEKVLSKVRDGETLIGYEELRERKDGKLIQINMTVSPVRDDAGQIVNIAAISRDVTMQRSAEHKLRAIEQEMGEALRRQQGIIFKFKKVRGRLMHTLCDGELLYSMGGEPSDVVGRELNELFTGRELKDLEGYYQRAWTGQEVAFEYLVFNRSVFFTLLPIFRHGTVTEVIGSCIDISELRKAEELLQKSEKLAVVGELAAGVAHEIRNPLTTLKGFTQLLSTKVEASSRPFLDLMLSELNRIESITNEFMVVAKPQALHRTETDMKQLVQQVFTFMEPQALLQNVELVLDSTARDSWIVCDGNQIKQVFINLIKNSLDSMESGGTLSVQIEQGGDELLLRIRDTGCGIPAEVLPRLGEPFYTLKGKGTGLGLMVSFRIIEAHHGSMAFTSKIDQGTTVEIRLPRA